MTSISIVATYAAINGLLVLVLSYNVGQHRARTDSLEPGAVGDKILTRAIRAHANATEYIPIALILLLLLALLSAPVVLLHGMGAGFTVGRLAQAYGMTREKHPNAIRFTGNLLTGLVYLIGAIACLYFGPWCRTSIAGYVTLVPVRQVRLVAQEPMMDGFRWVPIQMSLMIPAPIP